MTKSVKEKNRLSLIRKIRESNYEFFDPNAIKIKLRYTSNYAKPRIKKSYYRRLITKSNFKDKLKELLSPIVRHLDLFDFNILIDFMTYRSVDDYCFVMELQNKNRVPIGDISLDNQKNTAILVETDNDEESSNPEVAIRSLIKTINKSNPIETSIRVHFHHGKDCFKHNLKVSKIANLDKHFLFLNKFIQKIDSEYDFKLLSNKTDVKFFNTYYNIGTNVSYKLKPIFDNKSSNGFRNKKNYNRFSYSLIFSEHFLIKTFIDCGILPEDLKDDYQNLTLEQIFEYVSLMKY